jgi:hypothetical protein
LSNITIDGLTGFTYLIYCKLKVEPKQEMIIFQKYSNQDINKFNKGTRYFRLDMTQQYKALETPRIQHFCKTICSDYSV